MVFARLICLAAVGLTLSACAHVPLETTPQKADIYLLMGQSNMSGRGLVTEIPVGALPPDPMIMLYGNDGVWRVAREPLDSAEGQIDAVSSDNKLPGVGPGLAFAHALRSKAPSRKIALVPCAKGGSAVKEWATNSARTTLYGSCLARTREAMSEGTVKGVLWYQGETDATSEAAADQWTQGMEALVSQGRTDLANPCLSWVIVGLSDKPDPAVEARPYPAWEKMQTVQAALPQRIAHLAHVSAAGLPKKPDTLHLNTAGQLVLGPKLAEAMTRLQAQPCS